VRLEIMLRICEGRQTGAVRRFRLPGSAAAVLHGRPNQRFGKILDENRAMIGSLVAVSTEQMR
jgi:hypothetical protein